MYLANVLTRKSSRNIRNISFLPSEVLRKRTIHSFSCHVIQPLTKANTFYELTFRKLANLREWQHTMFLIPVCSNVPRIGR